MRSHDLPFQHPLFPDAPGHPRGRLFRVLTLPLWLAWHIPVPKPGNPLPCPAPSLSSLRRPPRSMTKKVAAGPPMRARPR